MSRKKRRCKIFVTSKSAESDIAESLAGRRLLKQEIECEFTCLPAQWGCFQSSFFARTIASQSGLYDVVVLVDGNVRFLQDEIVEALINRSGCVELPERDVSVGFLERVLVFSHRLTCRALTGFELTGSRFKKADVLFLRDLVTERLACFLFFASFASGFKAFALLIGVGSVAALWKRMGQDEVTLFRTEILPEPIAPLEESSSKAA